MTKKDSHLKEELLRLREENSRLQALLDQHGIDWFLDRCRTTINVYGDFVGAAVVVRMTGQKK